MWLKEYPECICLQWSGGQQEDSQARTESAFFEKIHNGIPFDQDGHTRLVGVRAEIVVETQSLGTRKDQQ